MLVIGFMVVEFVVGVLTGSLAVVSDAGHMAADAVGLGMALAAAVAAGRYSDADHQTFGLYRLEILAALANAVLLLALAGFILWEGLQRFADPRAVEPLPVAIIGAGGLVVNVAAWLILRRPGGQSLNMAAATVEVIADLLASIGVITAAAVIALTGWDEIDAVVAVAVAVYIVPRALRLGRSAVRVLVQAAPDHIDVAELRRHLESLPDVVDVHDLHVWTLTSEMEVASVHLTVAADGDAHAVLDRAQRLLREDFSVAHATLQVEPETHQNCIEATW